MVGDLVNRGLECLRGMPVAWKVTLAITSVALCAVTVTVLVLCFPVGSIPLGFALAIVLPGGGGALILGSLSVVSLRHPTRKRKPTTVAPQGAPPPPRPQELPHPEGIHPAHLPPSDTLQTLNGRLQLQPLNPALLAAHSPQQEVNVHGLPLKIYSASGDGNCFFHSITQLQTGQENLEIANELRKAYAEAFLDLRQYLGHMNGKEHGDSETILSNEMRTHLTTKASNQIVGGLSAHLPSGWLKTQVHAEYARRYIALSAENAQRTGQPRDDDDIVVAFAWGLQSDNLPNPTELTAFQEAPEKNKDAARQRVLEYILKNNILGEDIRKAVDNAIASQNADERSLQEKIATMNFQDLLGATWGKPGEFVIASLHVQIAAMVHNTPVLEHRVMEHRVSDTGVSLIILHMPTGEALLLNDFLADWTTGQPTQGTVDQARRIVDALVQAGHLQDDAVEPLFSNDRTIRAPAWVNVVRRINPPGIHHDARAQHFEPMVLG